MKNNNLLLITSCAVGLFATVGAALPYPVLPPLFADGQVNAINSFAGLPPKLLLGVALAINPFGTLIGSALLGAFSDRYGRRKTMLHTLFGNAVGHLLTMFALVNGQYLLFLLARFVTGLTEGNVSVMRALLADDLEGEGRLRAFAWLNGASFSGWLIGPLIAGATVQFGLGAPFLLAAAVLFITFLMALAAIPHHDATHVVGRADASIWEHVKEYQSFALLKYKPLRDLFLIHFCYLIGVTAFYEFFPLWLVEFAHLKAAGISLATAGQCAMMTATSMIVGRGWFKASDTGHLRLYIMLVAACIAFTVILGPVWGCVALVAFGAPHALYNAALPVYCSERFADYGHGAIMGMLSTGFCVSNVLVALVGSGVTLIDTRLALLLGAACSVWAGLRITHWAKQTAATKTQVML
jgi:DHA1 family tetracycline resistance protein-like MFS transporter